MKLTKREKTLALLTVLALVVFVCIYALGSFSGIFSSRTTRIDELQSEIATQDEAIRAGVRAGQRMLELEKRALPFDAAIARATYQKWLLSAGENYFGAGNVNIKPVGDVEKKIGNQAVYRRYVFTLSTSGTLPELTEFLHQFYAVPILHQVASMSIQPIEGTKSLNLTFGIEALGLPGSNPNKELDDEATNAQRHGDLADYSSVILNRNLFGPPNTQPLFSSFGRLEAITNERFELRLAASDSDKLDKLTYSLGEGSPEDARVRQSDDKTATLTWTPRAVGSYNFSVTVVDDGLPNKSDTKTFQVRVEDPRPRVVVVTPKPPVFDVAKYTKVTAVLQDRTGTWEVWIFEMTTEKRHVKRINDKFRVGQSDVVVLDIQPKVVTLEIDGERRRIAKGQTLREGEILTAEPVGP